MYFNLYAQKLEIHYFETFSIQIPAQNCMLEIENLIEITQKPVVCIEFDIIEGGSFFERSIF